jgi:hypothetical protein
MAVEFLFDAGNLKNFSAEWSGASNDQFTTSLQAGLITIQEHF